MSSITSARVLRPVGTAGKLFAFGLDVGRGLFKRPFQLREFLQQAWFIASVTIIPTALVAIPFGAVIALQVGGLIKQFGAQSFTGSAAVLAVVRQFLNAQVVGPIGMSEEKDADELEAEKDIDMPPLPPIPMQLEPSNGVARRSQREPGLWCRENGVTPPPGSFDENMSMAPGAF